MLIIFNSIFLIYFFFNFIYDLTILLFHNKDNSKFKLGVRTLPTKL